VDWVLIRACALDGVPPNSVQGQRWESEQTPEPETKPSAPRRCRLAEAFRWARSAS
jgi:hypothetical protein